MLGAIFRWETLWYLMLILYVPACVGLIVVVLLQKGKGVGFAGAFGVGPGSDAVFGPRGARTLPQKLTYVMAATFMVLAFGMSLISGRLGKGAAPEKVNEEAITQKQQTDLGGLDDLGSAIKEETPAPAGSAAPTPASSPVPAPAAPAAETTAPETPANEPLETPPPKTPATAPEMPVAPAPSGS
jgi:preprotein translocase subunit SecG